MKKRAVLFSVAIVGLPLSACGTAPEPTANVVASESVGIASASGGIDGGCESQSTVGVCELSCGKPTTVKYVTVASSQVASLEKRGDGVCAPGASSCCIVPGSADAGAGEPSVCTNFETDSNNCGACGAVCPAAQSCVAGTCACPTGESLCGSACVTESSDTNNCGACGVVCAAGDTCTSGVCVAPCGAGQTLCGGVCENTQSDPSNCGACGTVCPAGSICDQGACNSNPSPQCAGETCSTFTSCDLDGTCGGSGVCGSTSTGGGICVNGATPCAGLTLCPGGSSDCSGGQVCFVNSCCGNPVCVPTSAFFGSGADPTPPATTGATIASPAP
jgi:hypothetical protein